MQNALVQQKDLSRRARIAGAWYIVAIIAGVLDLMVLPGHFIKPDDAAATAHAILAQQGLFQALPVIDIACGTTWLIVVLALYRLLRGVDEWQARLMLILGAYLQVPFYFSMRLTMRAPLSPSHIRRSLRRLRRHSATRSPSCSCGFIITN